jgi:hypothetical protein
MQGDLPEFKRLQQETKQILEEFQAYNSDIAFEFVDPLEDGNTARRYKIIVYEGLTPLILLCDKRKISSNGFPWAIAV